MKKIALVVLAGMLGVLGLAAFAVQAQTPTQTQIAEEIMAAVTVRIATPAPDLPKRVATFSGEWMGMWPNRDRGPFVFVVEKINNKDAEIVYAGGANQAERYGAKVIGGKFPVIEFLSKDGSSFIFILKDEVTLEAVFIGEPTRLTTTAHRINRGVSSESSAPRNDKIKRQWGRQKNLPLFLFSDYQSIILP